MSKHDCPKCECGCEDEPEDNLAEHLLDIAHLINNPRGQLIIMPEGITDRDLARGVLALKMARLPSASKLRAMVEQWPIDKIIREVY